ncbi:disease resistance protein RGA2 [Brachypodium distachyon]|uniref:Uncharacterized protein n=1 Tax=Brachypodium distachyon TaxID=15368 RepID=A0A0Q3R1R8_BRADI|nr:disease resistance protein RGA2 [Brachypodium distachyon]XP_014754669.1 disease resistance protein RGA2 [Brachypodium distachyon]XP_024314086.1 disease resistance protein RGA2 [Brachypodium distachyon]XP_024314087.1 disease resistance protein RGA2 [Brachypodium distachyon]XP_024314088.1 disease resistance protein RGA2 [Brachypodium distachyon]XP_024314089.1 disease resistance protein RGA2 [Brachypodium distachyon]KQK07386.1 hypothetical protein BRADI_2g34986v3 [Brachypodium distachyon]PNT|eukprot:XP_010231683.1 disease resistance protein RGA2 [Brachypodium distachyon]
MAMVLDAFASYLQGMLTEMAADEIHLLLGVSVEIDKMSDKLGDLKNFLADADRRNITDKSVQGWVTELKRAMYDATDILDLCQLKAMECGESTMDAGCCNPFLFCLRNPFHAHDIGSRIKALNVRLDAIKQRSAAFSFINLGSYEDRGGNMHASHPSNPSRETSGEIDKSGVVGEKIKEDTRALVAKILQTGDGVNNNIMVVAIVGVGGIGKTTLAQNVFNNESIQSEFDKKIWLSVNQNFDRTELLRTAITLAGGDHRGEKVLAVLQPILTEALKGKKFLLVMDDLWSHGAWEGVLKTPLVNAAASSSRVLVTTRHEAVARGMTATWPHHHIDTLSPDDAWSLLKKQVLSNEADEYRVNMLKDVGLKIIQKCGGLPLAVKVMGGLLRQREMQRSDWEQVLDDSKWSMNKMPEDLNNAVYLSYEAMPPYLKQCFLYYCLLPKSNSFDDLHVIGMWISEGFIHGNSGDLEELGKRHYKELISRNLIELFKLDYGQQFCNMHDVVRSFGQYMAKGEALVAHNGEIDILTKLSSQKFVWLSIESEEVQSGEVDWKSLQEQQSMRTLISTIPIKMKPGDSLVTSSSLRTLYVKSVDVALIESLHQLKHLRYLYLKNAGISALPGNIGKMKFLQYLDLLKCRNLVNLPDSIVKLGQLRYLNLPGEISMIPRGFCGLTNMRILGGFPALMDGDWCSLDELGPLSQLRFLRLVQLQNASSAAKASLSEKKHLINLILYCTPTVGNNELDEQQRIEKVFKQLCPPSSVENIDIHGYFGQKLPSWMMYTAIVPLNNLKFILLSDLACCNQLPNGLCPLPCLQVLEVNGAPCISRVGTEFLHTSQPAVAAFPSLNRMVLKGMVEWEEWEWEEQVQAMPRLEELLLGNCKLRLVPPGLASQARALRKLYIKKVQQLSYLENFPSVVEITVLGCPDVERISNLTKLHKLTIIDCPKLKVLKDVPELQRLILKNVQQLLYLEKFPSVLELKVIQCLDMESITNLPKLQKLTIAYCTKLKVVKDVPALQRLVLEDDKMETLPEYTRDVNPRHLELKCSLMLLTSMAAGQSGPEFDKFSHIEQVEAKEKDEYMLYTREPYSLDTNINCSFLLGGTLSIFKDAQRLESMVKMPRKAFDYICSLVKQKTFRDMYSHTFLDGKLLCLEDRVAVALIVLNSGDTLATIGSSVGVNEATASLVTNSFVHAMPRPRWPDTGEMEKVKFNSDKIYGLPNCCGVIHTSCIPFGSQNSNNEKNGSLLMQVVIDSNMRFIDVKLGLFDDKDKLSVLHGSYLSTNCEKGIWLNGSKLKVSSDGSGEVGEYIIGDAGYPLLPWLLTPYQLENDLSETKLEFNKRHSEAMAVALKTSARFKDIWKGLHGGTWRPENRDELWRAIRVCCMLHNIVIGMDDEGFDIPSSRKVNYREQVRRQLAGEDAVRARNILSQYMTSRSSESRVDKEEQQEAASSSSGDKEQQELHTRTAVEKRNNAS